eukprot:gene5811-4168_t
MTLLQLVLFAYMATTVTGFRPSNFAKSYTRVSPLSKSEGLSMRSVISCPNSLASLPASRKVASLLASYDDDDEDGPESTASPVESMTKSQLVVALAKDSFKALSGGLVKLVQKLVLASLYLFSSIPSGTLDIPMISPLAIVRTASVATASAAAGILSGPKQFAQAASPTLHLFGHRQYKSLTAVQRLATTPVYFVANARGNAFLQDDAMIGNPEQKAIVYYMSSEDATGHLEEMAQSNPANAHEFHLVSTTLEKVVENIIAKKQSRKIGRYPMDVIYRIQPSSRQLQHATALRQKSRSSSAVATSSSSTTASWKRTSSSNNNVEKNGMTVPMFSAPGLVIKRSSGELVTPYYFALEDLQDDWQKMSQQASSSASSTAIPVQPPQVRVHDMKDVLCLAQGITPDAVQGQDLSTALSTVVNSDGTKAAGSQAPTATATAASTAASASSAVATNEGGLSEKEITSAMATPGIMPPRREIDMVKRYYRQQQALRGEFSRAKLSYRPE